MSRLPLDSLAFALLQAARIDAAVLAGQSLADGLLGRVDPIARPAVQDLVYGSLRAYGRGDFFLGRLLAKPLAVDEVRALLLVAIYRLETRPDAVHTVVDQAVAGSRGDGRRQFPWPGQWRPAQLFAPASRTDGRAGQPMKLALRPASGLVAGTLQAAYPNDWPSIIVAAGNAPPPMALRVNQRRSDAR
jgi:16S rRNA (cytosine967-C5)-methyltransferase